MTRNEVGEAIHTIIQDAVQRSKGNWRHNYKNDVELIFTVMGKLTPEPKAKPKVPVYDKNLIKRKDEPFPLTEDQRNAAIAALKSVGLL